MHSYVRRVMMEIYVNRGVCCYVYEQQHRMKWGCCDGEGLDTLILETLWSCLDSYTAQFDCCRGEIVCVDIGKLFVNNSDDCFLS